MERLIAENPKNAEVIFPYIGGEEVNSSPTHSHHRYVINFGERSDEECRRKWPELLAIVERKVKPDRDQLKDNADGRRRKQNWWQYGRSTPALDAEITLRKAILVVSQTSKLVCFAWKLQGTVFGHTTLVFPLAGHRSLSPLQSRTHDLWVRTFAATMKDDQRYLPSDCFETFPFPAALLDANAPDPAHEAQRQSLEAIGERYHQFRAELMVANNEGLTSTYNRFHDPAEPSSGLLELRRLHGEMDQAVLAAYGWSDVAPPGPLNSPCGFGLDYLDLEDDAQLPDDLQERIDSGELFFWEADVACTFEAQVRAYGAVKGKKKLPWRYRWPDDVRDDVLARLLALNAERYAEEVALGLHGKTGKKPATNPAIGGKRRGRPAKAAESSDTGQIGLAL
jgi:hypothetical protein